MKLKSLVVLSLVAFLAVFSFSAMQPGRVHALAAFACTSRTGGAVGSLDGKASAGLVNTDIARCNVASDGVYYYTWVAASALAESDPEVIAPDDIGVGNGRWLRNNPYLSAPGAIGDVTPSSGAFTTLTATTPVAVDQGGTGAATLTDHGILLGSGTGPVTPLGSATNGQIPIGSTGADPVLATITGVANETDVTTGAGSITIGIIDPLIVGKGGTGAATLTDGGPLFGSGTGVVTALARPTTGELIIGSTTGDPVVTTLTAGSGITVTEGDGSITIAATAGSATFDGLTDTPANKTGSTLKLVRVNVGETALEYLTLVPVAQGGTGLSTITDGGLMLGSGTGAVTPLAQGTNGQIPIGSTGVDPVMAGITAGSGITVTPGAGSITIAATAGSATFDGLTDTPANKTGSTLKLVRVNAGETALEYVTTVPVAQGGTGAATLTDGGSLYGSGTGAVTAAARQTAGQIMIGSTTGDPVPAILTDGANITITEGDGTITIASTGGGVTAFTGLTDTPANYTSAANKIVAVNGTPNALVFITSVPVAQGGTGTTTLTDGGIVLGSGTGAVTVLGQATNGQIPVGSTGVDPVLATITGVANETDVTNGAGSITIGIIDPLIVGKGGMGAATFTDHGVLVGSGTGAVTPLGVATNGQLIIGSTGADPVIASVTPGDGIDTTEGAGSLTITAETASTTNPGISELTTTAEAKALVDTTRALTAAGLGAVILDNENMYAVDSVGTDSYAITLSPAITAYVDGKSYYFKAGTVNTGAATLAINGLAAVAIKVNNDVDPADGDIEAGQVVHVIYDATATVSFQMQSQKGNAGGGGGGSAYFVDDGGSPAVAPTVGAGATSAISIGDNNAIGTTSTFSVISGGEGNSIGNARNFATVGGGQDNAIGASGTGDHSVIAGGKTNSIVSTRVFIGGGELNSVAASTAAIGGGFDNEITGSGTSGFIGAGATNELGGSQGFIGAGNANTISAASEVVIGGGSTNTVSGSGSFSVIGGGSTNSITGGTGFIGGGSANTISASLSVIAGGANNTASGINTGILSGEWAQASLFGQQSYAAGRFTAAGDAQISNLVARDITTDATPAEMFLDGLDDRMILEASTSWGFDIMVTGYQTATAGGGTIGDSASYKFEGNIVRDGANNTTLVGQNIGTPIEANASWAVVITADDTNESLLITVTGIASGTIHWVARIELVEAQ